MNRSLMAAVLVLFVAACAQKPCQRWTTTYETVCVETKREATGGMTCIKMGWMIDCDPDYRTVCTRWEKQPRETCAER